MAARIEALPSDSVPSSTPQSAAGSILPQLRNIDPVSRDAINAWLSTQTATKFRMDRREFELSWSEASPAHMNVGIELAFGPHRVLVTLDGFAALDPLLVGEPFTLLPLALRDLVVQRLLARCLVALPAALSDAADLRVVHWRAETLPNWQCTLGFTLRRLPEGTESEGILATDTAAALAWLQDKLPAGDASERTSPHLRVPLRVVLGRSTIEPTALHEVQRGDVVWIETGRPTPDGLMAALLAPAGRPGWRCRIRHGSLRVVATQDEDYANVAATLARDRAHVTANHRTNAAHRGGSGEDTMTHERSKLEIPVTFDLGELNVPLLELEQIQPGRLFDLPQDVADATVNLRVAGQLVAEGKLVAIGKRIGVRVAHVRMGGDDA